MSKNSDNENLFKDYCKAENSDDEESNNDLQTRLYAEIYYASNNMNESEIDNTSSIIPHNSVVNEPIIEQNMQHENKEFPETGITERSSVRDDTSRVQNSTNLHISIDIPGSNLIEQMKSSTETFVQTSRTNLTNQEVINNTDLLSYNNPVIHEYDNTDDNTSSADSSAIEGKESKKHRSKKSPQKRSQDNTVSVYDLDMNSKYNVLQKNEKQMPLVDKQNSEDSSDSDVSILEVPVPPKPQPLLINLQDSDEEDYISSVIKKDTLLRKSHNNGASKNVDSYKSSTNSDLEIIEVSLNCQHVSSKNKNIDKSMRNNASNTKRDKIVCNTRMHEDIVLNCTTIQKGASSINEIKHLSKSAQMEQRASAKNTSKNSKKETPENILRRNIFRTFDTNEISTNCNTIQGNVIHNHKRADQDLMNNTLVEVSCDNSNLVVNRKRYFNSGEETEHGPIRKQQCIAEQSNQNDTLTSQGSSSSSSGGQLNTKTNESSENFFKPMLEKLKFYNDFPGQENFDVHELQRGMTRDPRMWRILDEDLMPSPANSRSGRYFISVKCNYCRGDHFRKDCPEPPRPLCCYMCGMQGHTEKRCPQKMCLTCGKKQSTFRKVCEYCRTLYCTMCNSVGHQARSCPDLWRRYHQTTSETDFIPQNSDYVMKPANQLHCCNCTKRGHEASMCNEYRWSQHYTTPAAVTNYTDGPMYIPNTMLSTSVKFRNETTNISSQTTKDNRILTPQRHKNTPEGHVKSSPNAFQASAETSKMSTTSEVTCVPEIGGNSLFFIDINKSPYKKVEEVNETLITESVKEVTFHGIIYCYDNFDGNKNARMIVKNICQDNKLSSHGKRFIVGSLAQRRIAPLFLRTLQNVTKFKITIGYGKDKFEILLQLIALEDCIYPLYDLLFYWFNLPYDEKDYGLDVNLPMNSAEMFNILNSRIPNFNMVDLKNPLKLYEEINILKSNHQVNSHLWNLQIRLLKMINTIPHHSIHFRNFLKYLDILKQTHSTSNQLDCATYLQIVLIYNHLFVPHTPINALDSVNRILQKRKDIKKSQKKKKKQNLACSTNASPMQVPPYETYHTLQNINSAENPSTSNNMQIWTHDMSTEIQNVNDTSHRTTNKTKNCIQYPEYVSLNIEPASVQLNPEREVNPATNRINVTSNVSIVQPNTNKKCKTNQRLAKNEKIELKQLRKMMAVKQMYKHAVYSIKEARAFQLPHLMKAADDIERKINDKTLKQNHYEMLRKLIKLEKKRKQNVNAYHSYLQ